MDIVRVLRVIEYVGPRDRVEEMVKRSIHGEKVMSGRGRSQLVIRAATVGSFPEILEESPDANPEILGESPDANRN